MGDQNQNRRIIQKAEVTVHKGSQNTEQTGRKTLGNTVKAHGKETRQTDGYKYIGQMN